MLKKRFKVVDAQLIKRGSHVIPMNKDQNDERTCPICCDEMDMAV